MELKETFKNLFETIKEVQKQKNLPFRNQDIAEILGYNRTYISNLLGEKGVVTNDHIKSLYLHFPFLKITEETGDNGHQINEDQHEYLKTRNNKKLNSDRKRHIPFYEADAIASDTNTEMNPIHAPAGTIDIGDLLHDSQSAIRIYGNSMLPNYPPGCVVGLVETTDNFIQPGEVYVIETNDQRLLKRLFYKEDDPDSDIFSCYSDNTMKFEGGARNGKAAYPPFNLPKKDILKLFIVTGVIKRNSNSIIMNKNY